ncbi:MAG: MarR family winged helix-turn-helix transcriptional regulator [Solirubrobacteraceae bacterium]
MPPIPPPPLIPKALAGQTGYLARLAFLRAVQWAEAAFPDDVHPRYFGVLTTLMELGPRSQHELSVALHINRTIMVQLIDELEASGLVERRRNPDDRRSYALRVTVEGKRALEQMKSPVLRGEQGLTQPLSATERRRLRDLLRRVILAGEEHQTIPHGLAEQTGYLLAAAHFQLRERFEQALREAGIEPVHFGALATLEAIGPCSQQAIAQQLSVSGTAILQVVDRFEAAGLVKRRRNPADRRSYALEMTPKGHATLRRAHKALASVNAELATMLGGEPAERELHALLAKLLGASGQSDPGPA